MRTLVATILVVLPAVAAGQPKDPKFEFGKAEEAKVVEWKASAQAGLILSTGNSRSTALSGSLTASRKAGNNKLSVEAAGAFARSRILIASDVDVSGTISEAEIQRTSQTTTKNWTGKMRYDRFFSTHNSAYISAVLGADEPAGKELFGGGQLGYSRQLAKTDTHEVLGEAGYDFSYESYVAGSTKDLQIHSARLFAGWTAKLSEDTGFLLNAEVLLNLNSEDGPTGEIGAFKDTRVIGKTALTTKVFKRVDFRFSLTTRFDNAPAPQPPFKLPYDAGFIPLAEELDFTAEATLIVNFL